MTEFEQNQPFAEQQDQNPYLPPPEGLPEAMATRNRAVLPPLHWPRTIIMFVVLFVGGLAVYGFTIPFAFAVLLGGVRTALIYRGCAKTHRQPPSYIGSTILSPISCLVFQIAAGITFFVVCGTGMGGNPPRISEAALLSISGAIAFAVFATLYYLSIVVSIASCRPIQHD